jgi:hypothetical protein
VRPHVARVTIRKRVDDSCSCRPCSDFRYSVERPMVAQLELITSNGAAESIAILVERTRRPAGRRVDIARMNANAAKQSGASGSPAQSSDAARPIGVTAPVPVITTRCITRSLTRHLAAVAALLGRTYRPLPSSCDLSSAHRVRPDLGSRPDRARDGGDRHRSLERGQRRVCSSTEGKVSEQATSVRLPGERARSRR